MQFRVYDIKWTHVGFVRKFIKGFSYIKSHSKEAKTFIDEKIIVLKKYNKGDVPNWVSVSRNFSTTPKLKR